MSALFQKSQTSVRESTQFSSLSVSDKSIAAGLARAVHSGDSDMFVLLLDSRLQDHSLTDYKKVITAVRELLDMQAPILEYINDSWKPPKETKSALCPAPDWNQEPDPLEEFVFEALGEKEDSIVRILKEPSNKLAHSKKMDSAIELAAPRLQPEPTIDTEHTVIDLTDTNLDDLPVFESKIDRMLSENNPLDVIRNMSKPRLSDSDTSTINIPSNTRVTEKMQKTIQKSLLDQQTRKLLDISKSSNTPSYFWSADSMLFKNLDNKSFNLQKSIESKSFFSVPAEKRDKFDFLDDMIVVGKNNKKKPKKKKTTTKQKPKKENVPPQETLSYSEVSQTKVENSCNHNSIDNLCFGSFEQPPTVLSVEPVVIQKTFKPQQFFTKSTSREMIDYNTLYEWNHARYVAANKCV